MTTLEMPYALNDNDAIYKAESPLENHIAFMINHKIITITINKSNTGKVILNTFEDFNQYYSVMSKTWVGGDNLNKLMKEQNEEKKKGRLIITSQNTSMRIRSVMGVFRFKPFSVYSVDYINWRSDWNTHSDEEMNELAELLSKGNNKIDTVVNY